VFNRDKWVGLCVWGGTYHLNAGSSARGHPKAGRTSVPLDSCLAQRRLARILEDSRQEVAIKQPLVM